MFDCVLICSVCCWCVLLLISCLVVGSCGFVMIVGCGFLALALSLWVVTLGCVWF